MLKNNWPLILVLLIIFWGQALQADSFSPRQALVEAAFARTQKPVTYSSKYYAMAYPGGDVPDDVGVCSDVVIRAYRKALGIDLQQLVHEDMLQNFELYPKLWGLAKTDANIDHRRVPNLKVFFSRHAVELPISQNAKDYQPGDLVTWNLEGRKGFLPHIGIISNHTAADEKTPLVIHNIGQGTVVENMLFDFEIDGHYRYRLD